MLLDADVRPWLGARRGGVLDVLADAGQRMGRTANIRPVLAASLLGAYVTGRSEWRDATLHVATAYVAGDALAGALKPLVGRSRPEGGEAARFRPLTWHGDGWHSFPSAHAVHAFSLAAAIAEEARRPWVSVLVYGAASVVAWSRVYHDAHWASDVVAGALIGVAAGKATVAFLHRAPGDRSGAIRLFVSPAPAGAYLYIDLPR